MTIHPDALAVDGTNVYWVSSNGFVGKVSADGMKRLELAYGQEQPSGIAVDDTNVYWTTSSEIVRIPILGRRPATFATGGHPNEILVRGDGVFWTSYFRAGSYQYLHPSAVFVASKSTGSVRALASGKGILAIAVGETNVYWTDNGAGTVTKVPIVGGPDTVLASNQTDPYGIAVVGSTVFWANSGTDGAIMKMDTDGNRQTVLVPGRHHPRVLVADDGNLYWLEGNLVDFNPGDHRDTWVMKVPAGGGSPVVVDRSIDASTVGPSALALDATSIYWVDGRDIVKVTPK